MNTDIDLPKTGQVCEQLRAYKSSIANLADLVAVFSQNSNRSILLVFNTEQPPDALGQDIKTTSLERLLRSRQDLTEFDGTTIAFAKLSMVRPDIVTKGPRFYAMERLFERLDQADHLPETQLNLAYTLFAELSLDEKPPENTPAPWLKEASRLFRLTLPALLKRHQVTGLVAVVPAESFDDYLFHQRYQLVYRGCINKLLHLSTFTAFYDISSSIVRINIISPENMRIPDDAKRGNMMPIDRTVRTDVRTARKGGTHDDESSLH